MLNDAYKDENAVLHLLHVYTITSDRDILQLIPYIKKLILTQKYPEAIVEKTNLILREVMKDNSEKSVQRYIALEMINLLFMIGDAKTGISILQKIYVEDDPILAAYMAALIASDVHSSSVENKLLMIASNFCTINYFSIFINTCLLTYYMRTRNGEESLKFAKEIVTRFSPSVTIEYGFLLKVYSEFFNNKDALRILDKCIMIFNANYRQDLSMLCKITVASRWAYLGCIDTARKTLLESRTFAQQNSIPVRDYYYLNNFAALSIIEGNFSKDVEIMLQDALLFVANEYERVIILCNALIYYINVDDCTMQMNIIDKLESIDISCYGYEELRHIYHYNLFYAYRKQGSNMKMGKHREKLSEMLDEKKSTQDAKDFVAASLNGDILPKGHQWHFYSKLSYRPDFIGYWQFEMPNHNAVNF